MGLMLALLAAGPAGALGTRRPVTISGTVRVVGSEPLTRLVLTPAGGERDWLLVGPLQDELRRRHQGERVTLEGEPCPSPSPEFSRCFKPSRIAE
ncbi:hypothetical protein GPICK_01695 [Geobacter pickeringii]|uniref:Uncharacterized protein n=1 Tax=Geobacter pickeringii TaxID=345632 RepID=A0A0B5B6V8_9BACT|nr:hypothetical protein GPICK_01695 [Geobacter pickeringii]